jgi:lipopolysaccharide transport system ATP-binding protein
VGSLLEVGTGFHPELTGHENIYLYGAILGMDRWEITRKFDEIVAFAEIEKFIDTPVKKYSSGMYMRLAFAVAAHLEPEILLVDEVLAVGDAAFQKKCLGKMGDVAKEGRTILFVSHNMPAILALCQRGICFDSGAILSDQPAKTVVDVYLQSITTASQIPLAHRLDRQGNQEMRLLGFDLTDSNGRSIQHALSGQNVTLAFHYKSARDIPLKNVHLSIGVHGRFDENLFHLSTNLVGGDFDEIPCLGTILCRIDRLPLQPGKYSFNFFSMVSREIADWVQNAGMIEVEAGDFFYSGKLPPLDQGPFLVPHAWSFEGKKYLPPQGDES